jgi:hypothetical protein
MSSRTPRPSRHPEELLAAFVDGSLRDRELRDVEEHAAECQRCREEIRLARLSRDRLRDLPEVDVPSATSARLTRSLDPLPATRPAAPAATGRAPRRRGRDASGLLAGLGIAAAIVAVLAVALPRLATEPGSSGAGGAAGGVDRSGAAADAPARPVVVERQAVDYDAEAVADLAAASAAGAGAGTGNARAPAPASRSVAAEEAANTAAARPAISCVRRWAAAAEDAVPLRIIEATYEGTPAYLGVAAQRPPGEAEGRILVWVLTRDCGLISFTQRRG